MAYQTLHTATDDARYKTIPALIRSPKNKQAALAAMVEENEIRQSLSPWERARINNAALFARRSPGSRRMQMRKYYP